MTEKVPSTSTRFRNKAFTFEFSRKRAEKKDEKNYRDSSAKFYKMLMITVRLQGSLA
jgi:hypothetical protein